MYNCFTGDDDERPVEQNFAPEDNTTSDNIATASVPSTEDINSPFRPLSTNEQLKLCDEFNLNWVGPVRYVRVGEILLGPPSRGKDIAGDGNCLFRALCYAITGSETDHSTIRFLICQHIRLNNTYVGMNGLEYLNQSKMEQLFIPGTDVELMAAADMLSTDIYVFHRWGTQGRKWLRYSNDDRIGPAIYLDNPWGNGRDGHFDYVLGC